MTNKTVKNLIENALNEEQNKPKLFCKDCKWMQNEKYNPLCEHPKSEYKYQNLVTGEESTEKCNCLRMRLTDCGEEGIYWEPK